MTTPTHQELEPFGDHGEPCSACGAPLADDQRYCLNCGARRTGERVAYGELLAGREPIDVLAVEEPPPPPPRGWRRPGAALMGGTVALATVLVLGLGVVIGLLAKDDPPPPQITMAPQKAPIVNVTTTGGGEALTGQDFTSDWPEGERGFTVQLATLPNTSPTSDVDAAKTDAQSKGVSDVGALDSDEFSSLEPGNYVIYSGVFTGKGARKKARAALKKAKREFPDAEVVKVSSGDEEFGVADEKPEERVEEVDRQALEDLENATGEEQQKKSARLPDTIGIPGKAPPKDNKKPGGSSGGGAVIE